MCRFLMVRSDEPFETQELVQRFRDQCEHSREFQGHGWGASYRRGGEWRREKSLTPIWLDAPKVPERVDFLVLHARSAFRDEGIELENNMPFYRGDRIFVFNGELRGVRLRLPGRIGAERIFHLIERQANQAGPATTAGPGTATATLNRRDLGVALEEVDAILSAKSSYVRALNIGLTDGETIHAWCRFMRAVC